ncbi:MAG: phenylacetic acid degradation protein, partial [Methanobacteriota archaeon]
SVNPKIATYTVTITDNEGNKIAIFHGMVYRKTPRE